MRTEATYTNVNTGIRTEADGDEVDCACLLREGEYEDADATGTVVAGCLYMTFADNADSVGSLGLLPGTEVEVRNRYVRGWSGGFQVAAIDRDRYRIRRRSDGVVLPAAFTSTDVRPRL